MAAAPPVARPAPTPPPSPGDSITCASIRQMLGQERYAEAASSARGLLARAQARDGPESVSALAVLNLLVESIEHGKSLIDGDVVASGDWR